MRNLCLGVVWLCLFGFAACDAGNDSNDNGNLPGYGDDEIGFRNGGADEESSGQGDGDVDSDSDGDSDSDTDSGGDIDESVIDSSFLVDNQLETPWFGMIFEGTVSASLDYPESYALQNVTAGALAEMSLVTNPADTVLYENGNTLMSHVGISSAPNPQSSEYQDNVTVESLFNKDDLGEFLLNTSFAEGIPTLVFRNTYESLKTTSDVLRASCVVASNTPENGEDGIAGEGLFYAPDGSYGAGNFVSLAHKTKLTENVTEVSAQYSQFFEGSFPGYGADESLCICYESDGFTPMDCVEFDGLASAKSITDVTENPFYTVSEMPTSTFSIDVDTAAYTLIRQHLNNGALPDPDSVRIEEMINYFKYNYELPTGDDPFTIYTEMSDCPWNPNRKLAMIGMRGQEVEMDDQPTANLVYLLDVSGSMAEELWLIKPAFRMLTSQLRPQDTLSIVTYAGNDAVVLDGGTGEDKEAIYAAIDNLESGGSTNGAGGIQKAYELAEKHFIQGGSNRVILATDGDFNVGISDTEGLIDLISEKADTGVFLTVYGFNTWGYGNFQDEMMEQLADNGNGTYFFIDSAAEAERAFMHSLSGTLLTIAKDVKLQVQFNPDMVKGFRLIGYDNRVMANDDFDDDSVDAGELGNSEDMTAFYELILADSNEEVPPTDVEDDPNADDTTEFEPLASNEFMAIRIRYKKPESDVSELITHPITRFHDVENPSPKFKFAATIAQLGLVLAESEYIEDTDISSLDDGLIDTFGQDGGPAPEELLSFVEGAQSLID